MVFLDHLESTEKKGNMCIMYTIEEFVWEMNQIMQNK